MSEEKSRFEISSDELEHRMQKKTKLHDEPCQKAAKLLETALDLVMTKLGVNIEEDIPMQQEQLGIIVTEETREEMAGLQGFYVIVNLEPYCWIGNARLNHIGECFVDIHYFKEERLEEVGGERLIQ
jgi:hypothetical protein